MTRNSVNGKALPIFLAIALIIPVLAGAYRIGVLLVEWNWVATLSPTHVDNLPLLLHVIFAILFLVLGTLQILPGFRQGNTQRHRRLGRMTAVFGLLGAATGLLMTVNHPEISTGFLFYSRILFGTLWAVFIVLAIRAVLARNLPRHRAFMIRAYAIALNAGTLPFVYFPIVIIAGDLSQGADEAIQVLGWAINLCVAEWIIRRRPRPSRTSHQPAFA